MKLHITIALALLSTACTSQSKESIPVQKTVDAIESPMDSFRKLAEKSNPDVEQYNLVFETEKTELGRDVLLIKMNLNGGSFYVSPKDSGGSKGKFKVELYDNNAMVLDSNVTETPRYVESDEMVTWVTDDVSYRYFLLPTNDKDFEVKGLVSFTIEPTCTFEKIEFTISRKSGQYSVIKNM